MKLISYNIAVLLIIGVVLVSGCTVPDRLFSKTNLTPTETPVASSKTQASITPSEPTQPGLGNLCSGEEDCKSFCNTNKGICTEFCETNPQNSICQNPFVYDCQRTPEKPACKIGLEEEYNKLKNEIDSAISRNVFFAEDHYNRIRSDLDRLVLRGYQIEKIDELRQKASSMFIDYRPAQNNTGSGNQTSTRENFTATPQPPTSTPTPVRIAETQQWVPDSFTQPIPNGASSSRLVLPAPIDKIALTKIGPFGAHLGGHPEGLDHEWIEIKDDVPIGSWGDGEVTRLNQKSAGDYSLEINFGDGLVGAYMEIKTPLVKVGDKVKAGQPIGYGIPAYNNPGYQSGEFVLGDDNRRDGVKGWTVQNGAAVSPFDYLKDDVKQQLISEFTKQAIDPYISKGQSIGTINPWEPYLTNPLLIHKQNKGTIAGEWYLKNMKWATDNSPDVIILLKANTKYYNQNRIIANDEEEERFVGTWEADYTNKTLVINSNVYGLLYGIFELDESGQRATLKLEYQTGSYPSGFSDKAMTYIERDSVQRREDAYKLGVWCMQTSPCEPHCC